MLSNPCRYLVKSNSMRLKSTHILSNLYITKSLHKVVEDKEARNHSNISFDKFYVEFHDCHFWIYKCSSLQELTHVGRWTQIPSGAPNS